MVWSGGLHARACSVATHVASGVVAVRLAGALSDRLGIVGGWPAFVSGRTDLTQSSDCRRNRHGKLKLALRDRHGRGVSLPRRGREPATSWGIGDE
jgi:hypothetical protein